MIGPAFLLLRALAVAFTLSLAAGGAGAQDLSALARFDPDASSVVAKNGETRLVLAISQPVPWRVRVLDNPARLILDVREVDWRGINRLVITGAVGGLRAGVFRPGWSRLVIDLAGPTEIAEAEMATDGGGARVRLTLRPTDAASFAAAAARPEPPDWAVANPADLPPAERRGSGPIVVVLDPGHGGIDPGAERDGHTEADLMLTFARELKDLLLRDGRFSVVMTREEDLFVPLEARISIAREAEADLFLSLHADALFEGEAHGATLYTLSDEASDAAAEALAERHDRDDLLAGIDLTDQDDLVAEVLMDMARTETAPRTDRLADSLVAAIKGAGLRMHRHPRQQAGFSVLKSPDIPSILLEVGFLSSARDLKRILDPDWRAQMAEAVLQGILTWSEADTAVRAVSAP